MEIHLYDRELEVMHVLWELGSATVGEVRERIPDEMAYTTVQTVLRRLEEKGYVGHEEDGRAHRYLPLVERDRVQESALARLTRSLFQSSTEQLMTHLVRRQRLSAEELRRLRRLLDERLEGDG